MRSRKWYRKLLVLVLSFSILLGGGFSGPVKAEDGPDIIWLPEGYDGFWQPSVVGCFKEGLAAVKKDRKTGYIDKSGQVVIPFEYNDAFYFSEGLASVKKEERWGCIDKTGKIIIPFQYAGPQLFKEGLSATGNGYIDKNSQAVQFHYDYDYDDRDVWEKCFSEGLASVRKNGKYGYINKSGQVVIPFEYDWARPFNEGLAAVVKDGKGGYIDQSGQVVVPFEYDSATVFSEGLALVRKDRGWGYIDKNGRTVIPFEYNEHYLAGDFSEGLAMVGKDGKWGYIDKNGKAVTAFEYDWGGSFREGLAYVTKNGKSGYIDRTSQVVVPLEYDEANLFSEGVALVKKDGRLGILKNPLTQTAVPAVPVVVNPLSPELEAAVRLAVGKLSGELTGSDWQRLTALDLSGRHLSALSSLDQAKNLREIDLSFARVDDITALAQLPGLRTVILKNSHVPAEQLKVLKEKLTQTEFRVLTVSITDPNVKDWNTAESGDELVASAESMIAAAGRQELTAMDGRFVITKQLAESAAQKAETVKEQLNAKAVLDNKELNRSLETIVKISLTPEKEQAMTAVRVSKDIQTVSAIDRLVIEVQPEVTLELTAGDLQGLAAADLEIEVTEGKVSAGSRPVGSDAFGGEGADGRSYQIKLKKVKASSQITLALKADQDPYNAIFRKDASGKEEIIGGRYDGKTKKLNAKIRDDGEYYVRRNEKNFADIEGLPQKEKEFIKILAAKGILQGSSAGQFSPNATIQRSEILTILVRMSYAYDNSAVSAFSDVARDAWYYPYVSSGVKLGAVSGYPDNTFKPANSVGAAELAKMNCMMLVYKKGYHFPKEAPTYLARLAPGSKVPNWAKAYVAMAEREGFLLRTGSGLYDGGQAITRRQAAEMLYRLYQKL